MYGPRTCDFVVPSRRIGGLENWYPFMQTLTVPSRRIGGLETLPCCVVRVPQPSRRIGGLEKSMIDLPTEWEPSPPDRRLRE